MSRNLRDRHTPMNDQPRMKSQPQQRFAVQEVTEQQLSERSTHELRKLRALTQYGRHSPHFRGYPNTLVMQSCKRELMRRGLPVPPINQPDADKGDHYA